MQLQAFSFMRLCTLGFFSLATVLLVPFELWMWGGLAWTVALVLTLQVPETTFKRVMGVLLLLVLLLAVSPIRTETTDANFLMLGACFLAALVVPPLLLRKTDPGTLGFRMFPERFSKLEFFYTLLSAPLAYFVFQLYFSISPEVPFNWVLPDHPTPEALLRLFIGINLVGIWDELFFINTCFALFRRIYPFWWANLGQSVVYVSVLYDMAFRGWGPLFVLLLALTQGIMFQRSKAMVYVLAVHLIVDYFLFQAVIEHHYPGFRAWWHP